MALFAVACTPPAEDPPPAEEGATIVIGDISDDPGEVIEGAQPLADYLAERLGDYGITQGAVRVASAGDDDGR